MKVISLEKVLLMFQSSIFRTINLLAVTLVAFLTIIF